MLDYPVVTSTGTVALNQAMPNSRLKRFDYSRLIPTELVKF